MPRGNVRVVSGTNFLAGMYQGVLGFVLQRFVLGFGGGLTAVGPLQAFANRVGGPPIGSLVQPLGGHLADARGRRPVAILGSVLTIASPPRRTHRGPPAMRETGNIEDRRPPQSMR